MCFDSHGRLRNDACEARITRECDWVISQDRPPELLQQLLNGDIPRWYKPFSKQLQILQIMPGGVWLDPFMRLFHMGPVGHLLLLVCIEKLQSQYLSHSK